MAKSVFRVGEYHVGIQSNGHDAVKALDELLARYRVEDPSAPPNISIYEGPVSFRRSRPMYRIYDRCDHVFTTSSVERAAIMTAGYLEQFLPDEPWDPGTLRLDVLALVSREGSLLAPRSYGRRMPTLEVRLRREGIRVLEGMSVLVDTGSRELLVPAPQLAKVADGAPNGSTALMLAEGDNVAKTPRLRLAGWVFDSTTGRPKGEFSRAQAVARALSTLRLRDSPSMAFFQLATLIRGVDVLQVPAAALEATARSLLAAPS